MDGVPARQRRDTGFFWTPALVPGWIAWGTTAAAGLWSLWMVSDPAGDYDGLILLILLWFVLGGVWFMRVGVAAVVTLVRLVHRSRPRVAWWRFAVQLAIVAAVWVLVDTSLPLQARFALSRGGLEHDAKAILAGTEKPSSIHRSGLYHVDHVSRSGSTVLFYTDTWNGFAYAPKGEPTDVQGLEYEPQFHRFHGPWYRFDTPGVD